MCRCLLAIMFAAASLTTFVNVGSGQEIHVYTTVYDETAPQPEVISRSVSLFHAGKTYDYVDEVGEVIVFEPAHSKFTLLNTRQMKAATVHFDVIKRQLKLARETIQEHVAELKQSETPSALKLAASLEFQLAPHFDAELDESRKQLALSGGAIRYTAQTAEVDNRERVDAYLRYADWICRLNYVLHPGVMLPEPRLALNESLRTAGLMPTGVELVAEAGGQLHLRAEHAIHWDLNEKDRQLIRQWEQLLKSSEVEHVTFLEYQRTILLSQTGRSK